MAGVSLGQNFDEMQSHQVLTLVRFSRPKNNKMEAIFSHLNRSTDTLISAKLVDDHFLGLKICFLVFMSFLWMKKVLNYFGTNGLKNHFCFCLKITSVSAIGLVFVIFWFKADKHIFKLHTNFLETFCFNTRLWPIDLKKLKIDLMMGIK